MQAAWNYLLRKPPEEISPVKDGYVKGAATVVGLGMGVSGIVYAATSVTPYITGENAQYCANQTLAILAEMQRQIQILNASCTYDHGSNMSECNVTLLPKTVNTTCTDVANDSFINYVPMMFIVAGAVTLGLFMARSISTSVDQRNQQLQRVNTIIPKSDFLNMLEHAQIIEDSSSGTLYSSSET